MRKRFFFSYDPNTGIFFINNEKKNCKKFLTFLYKGRAQRRLSLTMNENVVP